MEVESHCGELTAAAASGPAVAGGKQRAAAAAAARSRCGLLRVLAGRPFCPRLAGMLLERLPPPQSSGGKELAAEMEGLRALLERQAAVAARFGEGAATVAGVSKKGGGGGGRQTGNRRGGAACSGSAMLLEDLV